MLKLATFLLVMTLLQANAFAQPLATKWSGQILDKQMQVPIPFVHIVGTGRQVISDSNGFFSVEVQHGDTLTFSHINFERYSILITETPDRLMSVYLTRKENLMQEVIIRDYLPEEALKREMIEYEIKYTIQEVNAINNVEFSTILYKKGYIPEMNSLDNFKNYMKEPQGVSLFSTDPSKGMIRSIKNLQQQNKTYYPSSLKLNKTDTVRFKR